MNRTTHATPSADPEAPAPTAPTPTTPAPTAATAPAVGGNQPHIAEELLIEEISIDGMCGVY